MKNFMNLELNSVRSYSSRILHLLLQIFSPWTPPCSERFSSSSWTTSSVNCFHARILNQRSSSNAHNCATLVIWRTHSPAELFHWLPFVFEKSFAYIHITHQHCHDLVVSISFCTPLYWLAWINIVWKLTASILVFLFDQLEWAALDYSFNFTISGYVHHSISRASFFVVFKWIVANSTTVSLRCRCTKLYAVTPGPFSWRQFHWVKI